MLLIVGPCHGWQADLSEVPRFDKVMVVNRAHDFWPDADFRASKETETFGPSKARKISGDTWINEHVDSHIRLNAWDSGQYAVKLAKHLGFKDIFVIGMRGTYNLPNNGYDRELELPRCTTSDEVMRETWKTVDAEGITFINSSISTYVQRA